VELTSKLLDYWTKIAEFLHSLTELFSRVERLFTEEGHRHRALSGSSATPRKCIAQAPKSILLFELASDGDDFRVDHAGPKLVFRYLPRKARDEMRLSGAE
jgi:hypothetical protein